MRTVNAAFTPQTALRTRYDLILALGVIYHFNDALQGVRRLAQATDRIIIETAAHDIPGFTDRDAVNFRDHQKLSLQWIRSFMYRQGFDVAYIDAWHDYLADAANLTHRHLLVCVRRGIAA